MLQPVIIAGGTGSRLWPISRKAFPKQFQRLFGESTMLQSTIQRLEGLECLPPIVICNERHRFVVAEQLRQIDQLDHNIILEPVGKNTAPAIALAALYSGNQSKNTDLLILPADHVIQDIEAFQKTIISSQELLKQNKLITFGIIPKTPETGYGYIKSGKKITNTSAFVVDSFIEKPSQEMANKYLEKGDYLWNSGMFAFNTDVFLSELNQYRPDIYDICEKSISSLKLDMDFLRVDAEIFEKCPEESVDYAVMENTEQAVVLAMDANWNDVGVWSSLWEVSEKDKFNNVSFGDVINIDSSGNYIFAETGLVATVGLDNCVIVQTKDAVLVTRKDNSQDVKKLVQKLQEENRNEINLHREVYRPWGKYDSIDNGNRYQVKRITVKPGEKLSVQMHHHRAEHWIVVSGTAKVTIDGVDTLLSENKSVYIPLGAVHALENPGKIELELIEIQVGSYLGEDDIVRFSDRYGRN